MTHPYIELTEIQHNALIGSMLGDGHLCIGDHNINAKLMISRAIKDKEYLQYEADIFSNFLPPRFVNGVISTNYIGKTSGKIRKMCNFSSIACPIFTPYHTKWYPNGKKIVPLDLELNAQIIAHWICDDGYVSFNKLPYRLVVDFSTNGFSKSEVDMLADLLCKRYNEEFLVHTRYVNDKIYHVIKAYDSACRAMFLDIDPYFKMERKRLWDKPESRFWGDPPERQRNRVKFKKWRVELLDELLSNSSIRLIDLAIKLKYVNDITERVGHGELNKLIKPYLENKTHCKYYDKNDNNTCYIIKVKD